MLHDIGKLEAYNDNPLAIDMTDLGRLIGEIPLGYYRVRREIESIEGFDPDLGWAVLHIILSHHGTLEHGSPVTPATREATLVHMMDNLGGKLGSFDRIERTLADGQAWSGFDRGIDGSAYFRPSRRGGLSGRSSASSCRLTAEAASAPLSLICGRSVSPGGSLHRAGRACGRCGRESDPGPADAHELHGRRTVRWRACPAPFGMVDDVYVTVKNVTGVTLTCQVDLPVMSR